jgi:hypothetical protein
MQDVYGTKRHMHLQQLIQMRQQSARSLQAAAAASLCLDCHMSVRSQRGLANIRKRVQFRRVSR